MVCYVVLGWCVTVCGSHYVVADGVRVTGVGWRYLHDGVWVTVCGLRNVSRGMWDDGVSWQRVGDAMSLKVCGWRYVGDGVLAYALELELDSETGKWIAHVSMLYNTVSACHISARRRHAHNALRYATLSVTIR